MKTTKFLLIGIISFSLFSCQNKTSSEDENNSVENKDQETSETTVQEEKSEEIVASAPLYGVDISKYQGNEIDLINNSEDSLSFIICRSSEGITYTDPKFAGSWKIAKEKGYIRGAYHFYLSDDSPEQQAANFLNVISGLEDTDLPPIIDFEEASISKGSNIEKVVEDLWKFIFIIEEKSGRKPIIYTDISVGDTYLTAFRFANYNLWIANYTTAENPIMPGAWKGMDWTLWQKSDTYNYENIVNDFDQFNGNMKDLKTFIANSITM